MALLTCRETTKMNLKLWRRYYSRRVVKGGVGLLGSGARVGGEEDFFVGLSYHIKDVCEHA